MRIFASETDYKNRAKVRAAYPSAVKIVKVCGGWAVYEYWTDYQIAKNQIDRMRRHRRRLHGV